MQTSGKRVRISATPSPSASRSRVMRLADGTPAPARFMTHCMTRPLMPWLPCGLGGALLSATSTSPLGKTSSQRGWSSPVASAVTCRPGNDWGWVPAGQPCAGQCARWAAALTWAAAAPGTAPCPPRMAGAQVRCRHRAQANCPPPATPATGCAQSGVAPLGAPRQVCQCKAGLHRE